MENNNIVKFNLDNINNIKKDIDVLLPNNIVGKIKKLYVGHTTTLQYNSYKKCNELVNIPNSVMAKVKIPNKLKYVKYILK